MSDDEIDWAERTRGAWQIVEIGWPALYTARMRSAGWWPYAPMEWDIWGKTIGDAVIAARIRGDWRHWPAFAVGWALSRWARGRCAATPDGTARQ